MKGFRAYLFPTTFLASLLLFLLSPASVAETELMAVDRDFNKMVQEKGLTAAFDHYLASDYLGLNGPYEGYDRADFLEWFEENKGKHKMKWWPVASQISESGDIGYTWGRYEEETMQEDGTIVEKTGKYITVWRKDDDGNWKSAVDMGATNPPASANQ